MLRMRKGKVAHVQVFHDKNKKYVDILHDILQRKISDKQQK